MADKIKLISSGSDVKGMNPGAKLTLAFYCPTVEDCSKLEQAIYKLVREITEPEEEDD